MGNLLARPEESPSELRGRGEELAEGDSFGDWLFSCAWTMVPGAWQRKLQGETCGHKGDPGTGGERSERAVVPERGQEEERAAASAVTVEAEGWWTLRHLFLTFHIL